MTLRVTLDHLGRQITPVGDITPVGASAEDTSLCECGKCYQNCPGVALAYGWDQYPDDRLFDFFVVPVTRKISYLTLSGLEWDQNPDEDNCAGQCGELDMGLSHYCAGSDSDLPACNGLNFGPKTKYSDDFEFLDFSDDAEEDEIEGVLATMDTDGLCGTCWGPHGNCEVPETYEGADSKPWFTNPCSNFTDSTSDCVRRYQCRNWAGVCAYLVAGKGSGLARDDIGSYYWQAFVEISRSTVANVGPFGMTWKVYFRSPALPFVDGILQIDYDDELDFWASTFESSYVEGIPGIDPCHHDYILSPVLEDEICKLGRLLFKCVTFEPTCLCRLPKYYCFKDVAGDQDRNGCLRAKSWAGHEPSGSDSEGFATLAECEADDCSALWWCYVSGSGCVQLFNPPGSPTGPYEDEAECEAACDPTWWCIENVCENTFPGGQSSGGPYADIETCRGSGDCELDEIPWYCYPGRVCAQEGETGNASGPYDNEYMCCTEAGCLDAYGACTENTCNLTCDDSGPFTPYIWQHYSMNCLGYCSCVSRTGDHNNTTYGVVRMGDFCFDDNPSQGSDYLETIGGNCEDPPGLVGCAIPA